LPIKDLKPYSVYAGNPAEKTKRQDNSTADFVVILVNNYFI